MAQSKSPQKLPRWSTETEMMDYGSDHRFIVIGESTKDRADDDQQQGVLHVLDGVGDYNCLGLCLGLKRRVTWPIEEETEEYLKRLSCQPIPEPSKDGTTIALYNGKGRSGDSVRLAGDGHPHVARHLGGYWFESKCGEGLHIAHRLFDEFIIGSNGIYGNVLGLWGLKEMENAHREVRFDFDELLGPHSEATMARLKEMIVELGGVAFT